MAAVKFVDVMVSVCYVAMLMPPQVSLDVGPAPCVAGPVGFGYALALVEWLTLRFQPFFVCAAMMGADGVYMMLELASRLAVFDGESTVPIDAVHMKLELAFLLAVFEPEISVTIDYDKAAAAIAGKCVFQESKRALIFPKDDEETREEKNEKKEKEEDQERNESSRDDGARIQQGDRRYGQYLGARSGWQTLEHEG